MSKKGKITATCIAVVVLAGLAVGVAVIKGKEKEVPTVEEVIEIPEPVTEEPTEPPTEEPTVPLYDYVPSETGMTERAKMLLKKNKDIVGWINIPHTDVDYPVVRDPGEIPEGNKYYGGVAYGLNTYYLDHDIDGSYLRCGSLFMDFRDDFGGVEEKQSENIVIYGHNMANNTMFGSLRYYRQDYSFWEKSPFIQMSSNYKDYDYVIFGFLVTSGNWYGDFIYWDMEELDTEESFQFYLDKVHEKQMYDTGIDVNSTDKLLTLSTCYANEDNSRFIVVARRLRAGEVSGDLSTIQRTEEYIKAHSETENDSSSDSE